MGSFACFPPSSLAAQHALWKNFSAQSCAEVCSTNSSSARICCRITNASCTVSHRDRSWCERPYSRRRGVECPRVCDVQRGRGTGRRLLPRVGYSELRWDASLSDAVQCLNAGDEVGSAALVSSYVADDQFVRSKLAVFLSGGGSNFRALHNSTLTNAIYGNVAVVVSDKPGCKGCQYARDNNVPVLTYPRSKNSPEGLSSGELVAALRKHGIDYVLLAGYLKLLPSELVQAYPRSILNIHPSLLPSFGGKGFYGIKVHEAVIKSGARFSGATVHFVDENFDTGPILAQRIVPVLSDDTALDLAAKVLKEEHILYSEAVAALCEDRIFWREDGVPLIRKSWNEAEYY